MNLSGEVIQPILSYYKVTSSHLLVLTDDLDQNLGDFKRKPAGGAGGQNGIKNIILKLGTDNFSRIKIGIGRPAEKSYDISNRVLSKFPSSDLKTLESLIPEITHQIGLFLDGKK
jgi:PTH1 family peptidyl-tRNA hydrolase